MPITVNYRSKVILSRFLQELTMDQRAKFSSILTLDSKWTAFPISRSWIDLNDVIIEQMNTFTRRTRTAIGWNNYSVVLRHNLLLSVYSVCKSVELNTS